LSLQGELCFSTRGVGCFWLGFLAEFSPAPPRVPVFSRCVGRPLQRCFAGRLLLGSSSPGSKAGRACLISWGERRAEGASWAVGAFGLITLLRQEGLAGGDILSLKKLR
jgi:hypothetical protein